MSWADGQLLAFDLETTGTSYMKDRIATACAAIVERGEVIYKREWTVAIDVDMPEEASAVNGLTTERLRADGRPAAEVLPEIVGALRYAIDHGIPVVAYNAAFDLTFTSYESLRWSGQDLITAIGGGARLSRSSTRS